MSQEKLPLGERIIQKITEAEEAKTRESLKLAAESAEYTSKTREAKRLVPQIAGLIRSNAKTVAQYLNERGCEPNYSVGVCKTSIMPTMKVPIRPHLAKFGIRSWDTREVSNPNYVARDVWLIGVHESYTERESSGPFDTTTYHRDNYVRDGLALTRDGNIIPLIFNTSWRQNTDQAYIHGREVPDEVLVPYGFVRSDAKPEEQQILKNWEHHLEHLAVSAVTGEEYHPKQATNKALFYGA